MKILTKEGKKRNFFAKNHFFGRFLALFGQNFQKYRLNQKFEKTVPREMYYHDFQAILAFLTQNFVFSLSKNFFYQNVTFCHFLKKTEFLIKFDIKNGFSDLFPFQKCILLYTSQL